MVAFDSIDDKFYDRVDARKDKLVDLMLTTSQEQDIFTLIFNNTKHLNAFCKKIKEKSNRTPKDFRFSLINLNFNDVCVEFKEGKQPSYHAEFLCFQFFDLYSVTKHNVSRYVYFEIYFDDNTLGVLMKKSAFNASDRAFPAFDLDRREWSQAKLQMRMWLQFYRVEVEEIQAEFRVRNNTCAFVSDSIAIIPIRLYNKQ